MAKLRVGLLFGGRSVEHEVSIASATSILQALDPSRYEVLPICVGHDGAWRIGSVGMLPEETSQAQRDLPALPGTRAIERVGGDASDGRPVDVIFPIIHGSGGEDGALQGFLELADVPYVGAGVLGSAVQMDKDVTKRLLLQAGIRVVPWVCVGADELADPDAVEARVFGELAPPIFVKPANLGSSVGTHKVKTREQLLPALRDAARYDEKILVERAIDGREIEVAVLGEREPEASLPGEIVEGCGMARVDFFLERGSGEWYVNELNSLPGFTDASMYPRLWDATGLPYPALLDRLIELAFERHRRRRALETTYRRG
jgi:D-alanine-D-alanine ligase